MRLTTQDITDDQALREYTLQRAGEMYAAGDQEGAVAMVRKQELASWRASLDAERVAAAPTRFERVLGAMLGAGKGAFPPFMFSLLAGALQQPAAAAAIASLTLVFAGLGAILGFCTGGALWAR